MKNFRTTLWIAVLIVVALVVGLEFFAPKGNKHTSEQTDNVPIGGDFTLTNHLGQQVTQDDFKGKLMLAFFGFTYCPDICPTDLMIMTNTLGQLSDAERAQVTPVFFSVDPERDTPEALKSYLSSFHPNIVGLTGTPKQVEKAKKAFRVYAKKVENDSLNEYTVDHTAFFYLMGKDGTFLTHFTHGENPDKIAHTIKEYL